MRMLSLVAVAVIAGCGLVGGNASGVTVIVTGDGTDTNAVPQVAVSLERFGFRSVFSLSSQNDGVETFANDLGATISLRDGMLVATRGFSADIMSADASASARKLASGGPGDFYPRFQTTLDGESAVQYQTQQCEMAERVSETITIFDRVHDTMRLTERCFLPDGAEINTYWVGGGGTVWKSRQWMGTRLGHMMIERLG